MGGYFLFWDMLRGEDADMKKLGEPFGDYARYLIGIVLMGIYTFLVLLPIDVLIELLKLNK